MRQRCECIQYCQVHDEEVLVTRLSGFVNYEEFREEILRIWLSCQTFLGGVPDNVSLSQKQAH